MRMQRSRGRLSELTTINVLLMTSGTNLVGCTLSAVTFPSRKKLMDFPSNNSSENILRLPIVKLVANKAYGKLYNCSADESLVSELS